MKLATGHRQVLPHRLIVALQQGQDVQAVGTRSRWQRGIDDRRHGSQHIGKTNHLGAYRACWDSTWPSRDERHAVAALPRVEFHASQWSGRSVFVLGNIFWIPNGAIVAGENHQRIFRETRVVQSGNNFSHVLIDFRQKIPIQSGITFVVVRRAWQPWRVWTGVGQIKKKRLISRSALLLGQKFNGAFGKQRQHLGVFEIGSNFAGPPKCALNIRPAVRFVNAGRYLFAPLNRLRGRLDDPIIFDKEVRWYVKRMRNTEKIIETAAIGPTANFSLPSVNLLKSVVPFSNHGSTIRVLLKKRRDGQRARRYMIFSLPRRITARQKSVAGRDTNGTWRMGIGESHPTFRQPVDMRSRNLALGVVTLQVAITHVVEHDKQHVGAIVSFERLG